MGAGESVWGDAAGAAVPHGARGGRVRRHVLLGAAGGAAALLAACGQATGGPGAPAAEAATVTYWEYQDQATADLFQKYVDAFNAEGRGVRVQHERVEGAKKAPAAA